MTQKEILLVEDDENIQDVVKLALEFEGYKVVSANNGKEALNILSSLNPGLILLDLMMPVMNGWEFMEEFRKRDTAKDIPVVVISAYSERAVNIDCTEFVQKPLELDTLLNAVKKHYRG